MSTPTNPHPVLTHLERDDVGTLQVRDEFDVLLDLPGQDVDPEKLKEKLWEAGYTMPKVTCYGYHFSTRKQMRGSRSLTLGPPPSGVVVHGGGGSGSGLSAMLLDQQFRALERAQEALSRREQAFEDEKRQFYSTISDERRQLDDYIARERQSLADERSEFAAHTHQVELELQDKRHQLEAAQNDRLWEREAQRQRSYDQRVDKMDAERQALARREVELVTEFSNHRSKLLQDAAAAELEAFQRQMKRQLSSVQEQGTNANPVLQLLGMLPPKALTRVVEAHLPNTAKDDDDDDALSSFVKQIEPLARMFAGMGPGAPALPPGTATGEPAAHGGSSEPPSASSPTGPRSFRG